MGRKKKDITPTPTAEEKLEEALKGTPITPVSLSTSDEFFDISGQAMIIGPSTVVVQPETGLPQSLEGHVSVVSQSPMFGIGFIPLSIFGQANTTGKDMWADSRGVTKVIVSGFDMYDPNNIKSMILSPKKVKDAIYIKPTDSNLHKNSIKEWQDILEKIKKSKKPFPAFNVPKTSPQYGILTGDHYRKYVSFFGNNVVCFDAPVLAGRLDVSKGKWSPVSEGVKKMECWADIIDNMRTYYSHKTYMDYLNGIAPKKFEDICKDKGIKDKDGRTFPDSNHSVLASLSPAMDEFFSSVKDISPFKEIEIRDVKIWTYLWKYWKDGIFEGISSPLKKNCDFTVDHDIKDLPKDTQGWVLSKNGWSYIESLVKQVQTNYKLDQTELLKASKNWYLEYDVYNDKFI